jgi:hypothetical protein
LTNITFEFENLKSNISNIKDKFVTEKVEFPKPDWDYIPIMEGGKFPKVQP